MHGSRGCFGCCNKSPLVISLDEPPKGLNIKDQHVKKQSLTEYFWSASPSDMDNSAFPSHRSISSISTVNQSLDTCSSSGAIQAEFVNHGLLLWNQIRQQWAENKGSVKQTHREGPKLSSNATYESLLSSNKPFPEPIPLPEMVDFLIDVWEQDGLYD